MSTKLFYAIDKHDMNKLSALLDGGVDANTQNESWPGHTALQVAISELEFGAPFEMVKKLIDAGADIDARDTSENTTALLMSIYCKEYQVVEYLFELGANPNIRSGEGDSPLRLLVLQGRYDLVKIALNKGATLSMDEPGKPDGLTALGIASRALDVKMAELLLENGANRRYLDEYISPPKRVMPPRTKDTYTQWNAVMKLIKEEAD